MSAEAIHFRETTSPEVREMALVLARANAQRDGEPLPSSVDNDQVKDMRERIRRHGPDAWVYIAAAGQRVVGFAFGYPRPIEGDIAAMPDVEYLSLLMVEPEVWGRGIASKLIDLVADRARRADRSRLSLWTREHDNARARDVYEHKGFICTGITRDSQYGRQVGYELDLLR